MGAVNTCTGIKRPCSIGKNYVYEIDFAAQKQKKKIAVFISLLSKII